MKKSRLYFVLAVLFGIAALVHFVLVLGKVISYPLCRDVHWILLAMAVAFLFDGIWQRRKTISHFSLLLNMFLADGKIEDQESLVMSKYAQSLGISTKRMMKILQQMSTKGKFKVYFPETEQEKKNILSSLSEVMVADGNIAPQEVEFIEKVAKQMGIDPTPYIDVPKPQKRNEYDEAAEAKPGKKQK